MKQKKLFSILGIILLLSVFTISCERTNFDKILYNQKKHDMELADHEARIKALENLNKETNTNILNLKTLIEASNKKLFIVSYKPLEDKSGYELSMSDSTTIVLKNGKDGSTPLINIKKDTDGIYYWTINGEWLLDASKHKVMAQGSKGDTGKDGITPKLRINTDQEWEVSLDNGVNWQAVMDSNGKPVKAVGPKGDKGENLGLKITEDDNNITIIYNGNTFVIPKNADKGSTKAGYSMTLTTTKAVGEKITLIINAASEDQDDVWIDLNANGKKDENEAVKSFNAPVEYPLASQTITVHGKVIKFIGNKQNINQLDVTKNAALQYLSCENNSLQSLDLTQNTALTSLYCKRNQLQSLDLTKNTALQDLSCSSNSLQSLDLTQNTKLTGLYCFENKLQSLNLTKNTALTLLLCYDNSLQSLDLTQNTVLTKLFCYSNKLQSLDLTKNTALTDLYCYNNPKLSSLNIANGNNKNFRGFNATNCPKLKKIKVDKGFKPDGLSNWHKDATASYYYDGEEEPIGEEPVKDNGYSMTLTTTKAVGEKITLTINAASEDQADVWIDLNANGKKDENEAVKQFTSSVEYPLASQTITVHGKVIEFFGDNQNINQLDVTKNPALQYLSCEHNSLQSLDLTQNTALNSLYCGYNSLQSLDLTKNPDLRYLSCHNNSLQSLDVTKKTKLIFLDCHSNTELSSLNIANGNNKNFHRFNATNCPKLTCIKVDKGFNPEGLSDWDKDATARWNNSGSDCD